MADKITTFSPDLAKAIARFFKQEKATGRIPNTQVAKRFSTTKHCFARITGIAAGAVLRHSWVEVTWNVADDDWIPVEDGLSGDVTDNFVIRAPQYDKPLEPDEVYKIIRVEEPNAGVMIWVAPYSYMPVGQYQFMLFQMVSQNQAGYDFGMSHPIIEVL